MSAPLVRVGSRIEGNWSMPIPAHNLHRLAGLRKRVLCVCLYVSIPNHYHILYYLCRYLISSNNCAMCIFRGLMIGSVLGIALTGVFIGMMATGTMPRKERPS